MNRPRPAAEPTGTPMRPLWSQSLAAPVRGLALAREKGWLLAWDEAHWLYLLNQKGERQAQIRAPGALVTACCSDDGSAWVALGSKGEVWWLAPDLTTRWERSVVALPLTGTLDPFGQYLAVSDTRGHLQVFNRLGQTVGKIESPRPLHHLAFSPASTCLFGAADYGLVACFGLPDRWLWRDGLVAHVGAMAVAGDGNQVALACFSEGVLRYSGGGAKQGRLPASEACRLVSLSFDGRALLLGGLTGRVVLLDATGTVLATHLLDRPLVALALAPLGDTATVAQVDGPVVRLSLKANEGR